MSEAKPRQNRVSPFGQILAVPERGTMTGNRGVLHDAGGRIQRPWRVRRWIICLLEFKGRHREIMTPNRYTELFFLDEATGLAAGHRPCAECSRARFVPFRDAFVVGDHKGAGGDRLTVSVIDDRLHRERITPLGTKRTFRAYLDHLPDGVFVTLEGTSGGAHLVLGDALLAWSPGGYTGRQQRPGGIEVSVLTPRSTLAAIRAGYEPEIHSSAFRA